MQANWAISVKLSDIAHECATNHLECILFCWRHSAMRQQTAIENSITAQWHPDLLGHLYDLVIRQGKPEEEPRECGGLLLGTVQRDGGRAQIIVRLYTPISLSLADRANLQQLIASYASPYWSCIGFYRTDCRPGLEPDAEDLQLAREYLKDQPGLLLLLSAEAPHGSLYLFDGLRLSKDSAFALPGGPPRGERGAPVTELPRSPSTGTHPPTDSEEEEEEDTVATSLGALAGQLQEYAEPVVKRTTAMLSGFVTGLPRKRIPAWLMCTLVLLVVGLVVWIRAERQVPISNRQMKSSAPATRSLGLMSSVELDHIHIGWNPHAPAVARASSGTLSITDGTARRTISLDQNVLAHGSVAYYPTSDLATFELRIGDVTESLVAMGLARTMPVRPSLREPADTREDVPERAPETALSTRQKKETRSKVRQQRSSAPARSSKHEAVASVQPAAPAREPVQTPAPGKTANPAPSRAESPSARPGKQTDLASAQPIKRVFPRASGDALKLLVGSVTIHVQVHIDSQGRVVQAAPMSHGGTLIENLSDLSVNAAREWVFAPARRKGRDVESNTVLEFVFNNQGIQKPAEN
jgi:hypothetical protein